MIVRNVLGHAGVELLPRSWLAGWWGRWFTTTLHHDLHHAHGRLNYGLYFTFWDRLCGTEHPDYRRRLLQLADRGLPGTAAGAPCSPQQAQLHGRERRSPMT
jgi:sterol desaturase/sphingolipid hydroxylase (fatty acid hydroxylase superfamily)